MTHQLRLALLLVISQAACLAFGLWVQDRFLLASAEWSAARQSPAGRLLAGEASQLTPAASITAESLIQSLPASRAMGFIWTMGLQAVLAYLVLARMASEHQQRESQSREENLLRSKELLRTRDAVIFGLAKLAESRDPDTGHHLERISLYATRLATGLRRDPRYRDIVTPAFVRTIGISSALHDIGKVGVEDAVLLKPGRLSDDERFRMQIHPILGGECIRQIEQQLGDSNFLEMAREIAFCHHEHWDGKGYPVGLVGEEIPLSARIVAIADVYDALSSRRVYKEAYSHETCVEIIRQESGRQFDPNLVDVFLKIHDQFRDISIRFADFHRHVASLSDLIDDPGQSPESGTLTVEQEQLIRQTVEQDSARKRISHNGRNEEQPREEVAPAASAAVAD